MAGRINPGGHHAGVPGRHTGSDLVVRVLDQPVDIAGTGTGYRFDRG